MWWKLTLNASLALLAGGCQQHPADLQKSAALALTGDTAQRQYSSRRFEIKDEISMMAASAGVLQDLGFNIDETSRATGLIVASKNRDAVESG